MHSLAKAKVLHQILSGILGTVISGCSEYPNPDALAPYKVVEQTPLLIYQAFN